MLEFYKTDHPVELGIIRVELLGFLQERQGFHEYLIVLVKIIPPAGRHDPVLLDIIIDIGLVFGIPFIEELFAILEITFRFLEFILPVFEIVFFKFDIYLGKNERSAD
jgi:hypothetical protein